MERLKNFKTLSYPDINKQRGFEEILNSPIYRDYVISEDGKTSGIVVYLKKDKKNSSSCSLIFIRAIFASCSPITALDSSVPITSTNCGV